MRADVKSVVVLVAMAGIARADLSATGSVRAEWPMDALTSPAHSIVFQSACLASEADLSDSPVRFSPQPDSTLTARAAFDADQTSVRLLDDLSATEITELPPAPGSGRLVCSGLLTLLAWPVLRSARNLHLGAMPCWIQTAGPHQIGHRVAFDWQTATPLIACPLETPQGVDLEAPRPVPREYLVITAPIQVLPRPSSPRSPPWLAALRVCS